MSITMEAVPSLDDVLANTRHYLGLVLAKEALSPLGNSFCSLLVSQLSQHSLPPLKPLSEEDSMQIALETCYSPVVVHEYWTSPGAPLPSLALEPEVIAPEVIKMEDAEVVEIVDAGELDGIEFHEISELPVDAQLDDDQLQMFQVPLESGYDFSDSQIVAQINNTAPPQETLIHPYISKLSYTRPPTVNIRPVTSTVTSEVTPDVITLDTSQLDAVTGEMKVEEDDDDDDNYDVLDDDDSCDYVPGSEEAHFGLGRRKNSGVGRKKGTSVTKRKTCSICEKDFSNILRLRQHTVLVHSQRNGPSDGCEFLCSYCNKSFFEVYELHRHEKTHTTARDYQCMYCEKTYKEPTGLKKHMQTHAKGEVMCEECGEVFQEQSQLNKHKYQHNKKKHSCGECQQSFENLSFLKRHNRIHHPEKVSEDNKFCCQICGKLFSSRMAVDQHTVVHDAVKPFVCQVCGAGYTSVYPLRRHEKTHTQDEPQKFTCSYCGKSFKSPWYLKVHIRQHTGETPYECSVSGCGKMFRDSTSLLSHERRHVKDSNLGKQCCLVCGKYVSRGYLTSHMRVHTREKPFTCPICKKVFRYQKTRHAHMKLHKLPINLIVQKGAQICAHEIAELPNLMTPKEAQPVVHELAELPNLLVQKGAQPI